MSARPLAVVILAAGRGTRMRSNLPKVLHPVGGRPMIHHVLDAVAALGPRRTVLVVGAGSEAVARSAAPWGATTVVQDPPLGTAHAVAQAAPALEGFEGDVLILFGDCPLVRSETLRRLHACLDDGPAIGVLAFRPAEPGAYGRILLDAEGRVERIVEARDATEAERSVGLCNAGPMIVRSSELWALLAAVGDANAAREHYLPDIVAIGRARGLGAQVWEAPEAEVLGVNDRADLARAEAAFQHRRRAELMALGVTLLAPETVFLAFDTRIGRDSVVEPFVVFGPGVEVGERVTIRAHSHLEGARVAAGAVVGPFARLRPGADLGEGVHVGNFVEVKASRLGAGAKANHLAYIGDAEVGARANIGAGTITCNYDGFAKHRTVIGDGAFIGSNSALVAPVTVGAGAIVGAGSVITRDVAEGALALGRAPQVEKPQGATRIRARRAPG
ncbi:MAG: bifunctional UDP-N-acetylglucosamine diphosphorylase/glucosamine-1-phosphate N-acetyltransferase GlmU [Sphingomonadaceae bacterium]|uniref:bifunctional UDP-N-acetylglucosamine diphosphorylase/glucosamine-1-phosphate N-acetyltransferase GlmU n=1 Tax=Thermaurantiacus sp. TaxID=2820283 RepID=UPI00298F1731|nr:bifunctional UDP-N-acetylglucosamine diphosphorylase/glucosamine-1-phosphate N-acetyltransferase GlmU [Thermaurantiacus sp.]MCS6987331.1 bifunctional UDP-N-acetylglucosamine diphosphorylase/glucosamine-1-phosphate N-acetyltransferase GlmU [Sphingomonadaceae bacterium]MDW8414552.1 bifunctional UDP-N-acetylglucosamine diphosphorylase/glucosamine-1-phosphate N-acetyltransferase GlmU [Thermaurantiacus sp.]